MHHMNINYFMLFLILSTFSLTAQNQNFTHQDTLRGSITPERSWWDLTYYHLDITIDPENKSIRGTNTIYYKVLERNNVLQVDLQSPLVIEKVVEDGVELKVRTDGNAHFVTLQKNQKKDCINKIEVYYKGIPREAVNAPWDGGISWKKDINGNHFIASSCQGLGASAWWPNKDHMYDEVDSMLVSVTVPKGLINVSNGRLRKIEPHESTKTYHWFISNPINNYGVNINIGDYVHFGEQYEGEKGTLDMDYYVLKDNLEQAKEQFKDAPRMMQAFEHWFGPYPFYEDSFKLVEVPYLGMEHQSSVTYGNKYVNGYLGNDLSDTGWGLKFDFIIIHESGHEWFANSITNKDIADMWIHESFTAYSECLFLDYHYGKEAASEYIVGTRRNIQNDVPIIGAYNVNSEGSFDMYYKGANMLHTLRQLIDDDAKWRLILRGMNKEFYHQTVTTQQIETYLATKTGLNLIAFFNQYLRSVKIPILEYNFSNEGLRYRYTDIVEGFDMPVRIYIDKKDQWIQPNADWQTLQIKADSITIDPNFFVIARSI